VSDDLQLAFELADLADSLSLPRFRAADLAVEAKADLTPVTDADRAVERAIRERLSRDRPDEAVLGEEEGAVGGASTRWIVDPIDGTKNFSRGIPIWATLIALERDGALVASVVSAPALRGRWWAARGEGAYADGRPIRVSRVSRIEDAVLSFSRRGLHSGMRALIERSWHARTFSDFWQHVLVAEGAVDAALDPKLHAWDIAAVKLVIEEAGGRCTDTEGRPGIGASLVSSNGLLHDTVLAAAAPGGAHARSGPPR
jgi:histidinol-phosphatase